MNHLVICTCLDTAVGEILRSEIVGSKGMHILKAFDACCQIALPETLHNVHSDQQGLQVQLPYTPPTPSLVFLFSSSLANCSR